MSGAQGKVYLVGAGPGDPDLLTIKAYQLLKRCDVVIYDALINVEVLRCVPSDAEKLFIGEAHDRKRLSQTEIGCLMIDRARRGKTVVRLKGGDPFIFGRGGEEVSCLSEAEVEWQVVPGISAGHAVPAYAGIPLTHRDYASSVAFVTGHECESRHAPVAWQKIATAVDTIVIFMGTENLQRIVAKLLQAGRSPATPIAIIESGTLPSQSARFATLDSVHKILSELPISKPALIVIGEVVSFSRSLREIAFIESNV